MKDKKHLTKKGLKEIQKSKLGWTLEENNIKIWVGWFHFSILNITLLNYQKQSFGFYKNIKNLPLLNMEFISPVNGYLIDHLQVELIMDPWFVTGFTDGEGSFLISIIKDNKYKLGWRVICRFEIHLNKKDLHLLKKIKSFFNVGNIYFTGKDKTSIQFRVESHSGLVVIINHFEKYPLITKKKDIICYLNKLLN